MQKTFKNKIFIYLFIAFFFRLFLAFNYDTGDTGAVTIATELYLKGEAVYSNPNVFFSPPPFALHVLSFIRFIADNLKLPFNGFWKLPAVVADIGIGYMIYVSSLTLLKRSKVLSKKLMYLYLFNPISLFISGYHGQQDSVWLFMILIAWYLIIKYKKYTIAAIISGIAVSYKLPALLIIPFLVMLLPSIRYQFWFLLTVLLFFITSLFPEFIQNPNALLKQVLFYSSTPGIWGVPLIARMIHISSLLALDTLLKILLTTSVLFHILVAYLHNRDKFLHNTLIVLILFFILTPGFANQYLIWPLPFVILTNNRYIKHYTFVTGFAFLHIYNLNIWPLTPVLNFFAQNIYLKYSNFYPYILYIPIWFVFLLILKSQNLKYEKV